MHDKGFVLAVNKSTKTKHYVPRAWLSDDSPFPGQWRLAASVNRSSTVAGGGTESAPAGSDDSKTETHSPQVD